MLQANSINSNWKTATVYSKNFTGNHVNKHAIELHFIKDLISHMLVKVLHDSLMV